MTFKAEIKAQLGWNWEEGAVDNDTLQYIKQLNNGSGDSQAEAVWHQQNQTLLSGAAAVLDLTALAKDVFGDVLTTTFTAVKAIQIVNWSTTGGQLLVGGAGSDEWSEPFGADGDQVRVPPDSPLILANRRAGWPVDDSHKNLKILASGGDVVYSMAIVGTLTAAGSTTSSSSGI